MGSIEVIDLYSIAPLDRETILRSAVKTGAVVIVEDGHHSFGLGGEILASVIESGISLRYGLRISGADTPTPYAQELEAQSFPSPSQIENILRQVLEATR
jgi:pyruvate dehydrogenase E1 component beta subunit